jgi:steroid 5-alpha reductase family enzyme
VSLTEAALLGSGVALAYVTAVWLLSLVLRNASIIDIFWGPGFLLAAVVYTLASPDGYGVRQALVVALVAAWALRLGGYILLRNAGHGEDSRYRSMRENAGEAFWWRSLLTVFLLQGTLLWIISAPLLAAVHSDDPDSLGVTDYAGAAVWAIGFGFEAISDWQLALFKRDPANKGKVMDRGLWRYTRHPNYFGEAVLWWGYFIIAAGTDWGWVSVFSPALMTFLLLRVSGVAMLERGMTKRRPGYEDYIRRTSAFVPWRSGS